MVGFELGYRVRWQTCLGALDPDVIIDNTQRWSADHCSVDPSIVPGILFSSLPLRDGVAPGILDVAPTVFELLTVPTLVPELQLLATSEVSPHSQPSDCDPLTFHQPESQLSSRQLPPGQDSEACGMLQTLPQEPQFEVVSREVSHPLGSWLSQSSHQESQLTIWHTPLDVHVSVAWARLQT